MKFWLVLMGKILIYSRDNNGDEIIYGIELIKARDK